MVLLSAAICTKTGKAIVARQFMEVSRSRIEGLLAAFPKLKSTGDQHTFVETDAVRYVYQPMDTLFVVLITTKNSNILEDLETLRLFARVVPEYCREMSEQEVMNKAYDLIFAFDEIVALGYRENVSLSQIRTYTEMESLTENMYRMEQKNKEREAKEQMKIKAKELQMQRKMRERAGLSGASFGGGISSGSYGGAGAGGPAPSSYTAPSRPAPTSTSTSTAKKASGKGMKLGGKAKTKDFMDALMAEGEDISAEQPAIGQQEKQSSGRGSMQADMKDVHVRVEERITLSANRDGGLENMEVKGTVMVQVNNPDFGKIKLQIDRTNDRNAPFQTHPNMDKKAFQRDSIICTKNPDRPFPVNSEVGVLKWRIQGTDDSEIPLTINCWPTVNGNSVDVNVDYELLATDLELRDVLITIPLPSGSGAPVVASADGSYHHDSRHSVLTWQIPMVDADNTEGSIEFTVKGSDADDFFPVLVDFQSSSCFAGIKIGSVTTLEGGEDVPFSSEVSLAVDTYEIV